MEHPTHVFSSRRTAGPAFGSPQLGGWAGVGLMASTLLMMCPAAQASTLTAWQFDPASQQLTLTLPSGVIPQYAVETNPARIVLTIPQTQVGAVTPQQTYSGAVSQVRLSQVNDDTVVVLELAPNAVLTADGASLVALAPAGQAAPIAAADQTRWVLTALVAGGGPALAAPGSSPMIVELPVMPGNDPRLGFPAAGRGRLSTSAANLMLPSDINNLTNLPETLPLDPFNLGRSGEQVTVPSLAELDAAVGPVATTAPTTTSPEPPVAVSTPPAAGIATLPPEAPPAGVSAVLTLEPPPLAVGPASAPPEPTVAVAPALEPEALPPERAAPEPEAVATIDAETSGIPIAVTPPAAFSDPDLEADPELSPAIAPDQRPEAIAVEPPATAAAAAVPEASPEASPEAIAVEPPVAAPSTSESAAVIAVDPPGRPQPEIAGLGQPSDPSVLNQEPPPIATVPVELNDPNRLAVPTAPNATVQGTVVPPEPPVTVAAAGQPILFGTPLPNGGQPASPDALNPAPAERPISPDTLVAAGTVLELRYVGNEALNLNTSSSQNQVLLLAQDIRDPITNGIVAPAGSQLIGQFESTPRGQQWVSKMLIAPAGQQVAFSTTSDYLIGSPDITTPRVAAGAGLGALALLLVTGFSGIGLVGGAIVGATTMVGTAPQHVVIEPNQIIQVQVIQDIPRAIPIASAPEHSREWGSGGW
ncbi:MAG: AMIN domain-containing protein [Leptolyngbya sp. DLM2.Bin27]|nr:MAG: AMIN domain-containing protein [Leptolyngbya sp. DLM2.Bin27]